MSAAALGRLLTVATVSLICGWAAFKGVELTFFLAAENRADVEDTPAPMMNWTSTVGVASRARNRVAEILTSRPDARASERAVVDSLARAPLDAGAWLRLAKLRLPVEKRFADGLAALKISSLFGPNEGHLMAVRATLALPFWRSLPRESRRLAIDDLIGGWVLIDLEGRSELRAVLAREDATSRAEIARAVRLNVRSNVVRCGSPTSSSPTRESPICADEILDQLGLSAAQPATPSSTLSPAAPVSSASEFAPSAAPAKGAAGPTPPVAKQGDAAARRQDQRSAAPVRDGSLLRRALAPADSP